MVRYKFLNIFVLSLAIALSGCAAKKRGGEASAPQPPPAKEEDPVKRPDPEQPATALTVIATTDFHGALEGEDNFTKDGKKLRIGGAEVLSAYAKILRARSKNPVIWIDAGDLFQGTMASNMFEGMPVIRLYNYLGVNAAALGNHEFDYGPVGPNAVPRSPSDDPRGALKALVAEAKFPILAANVQEKDGSLPSWLKRSTVVNTGGLKVGVIGAALPSTQESTNILNVHDLNFADAVAPVVAEARRLREREKVQAVILTMHEGGGCDKNGLKPHEQDDLSDCKEPMRDIIKFVKRLPDGLVDVVVAGHTHRGMAKRIGRTVIMQAYSAGKYIAWAKVPLGKNAERPFVEGLQPVCQEVIWGPKGETCDTYNLPAETGTPEPAYFMGERIVPDAEVVKLLSPALSKAREITEAPLGVTADNEIYKAYGAESPLGNLSADLLRKAMPGVDLGLQNGGGLRTNLNPGALTYGHVFSVLPFDNQMAVMKVTGTQLIALVKHGTLEGQGAFTWSENLRAELERCNVKSVTVDGNPVEAEKIYTIATSDYLANGGSGVSKVVGRETGEVNWDPEYLIRDVVVRELKKFTKNLRAEDYYTAPNARIKISGSRCPPGA